MGNIYKIIVILALTATMIAFQNCEGVMDPPTPIGSEDDLPRGEGPGFHGGFIPHDISLARRKVNFSGCGDDQALAEARLEAPGELSGVALVMDNCNETYFITDQLTDANRYNKWIYGIGIGIFEDPSQMPSGSAGPIYYRAFCQSYGDIKSDLVIYSYASYNGGQEYLRIVSGEDPSKPPIITGESLAFRTPGVILASVDLGLRGSLKIYKDQPTNFGYQSAWTHDVAGGTVETMMNCRIALDLPIFTGNQPTPAPKFQNSNDDVTTIAPRLGF